MCIYSYAWKIVFTLKVPGMTVLSLLIHFILQECSASSPVYLFLLFPDFKSNLFSVLWASITDIVKSKMLMNVSL